MQFSVDVLTVSQIESPLVRARSKPTAAPSTILHKLMDHVIEIEICLQYLNYLFAKSVASAAYEAQQRLAAVRHDIYYGEFDYTTVMQRLEDIGKELEAHVRRC